VVTWLAVAASSALAVALNATGIPLIVLGVAALVAGLYLLWKNFDKVKAAASAAFGWISDLISPLLDKLSAFGDMVGNFFGGAKEIKVNAPQLAGGGTIKQTGMAEVHKGEFVGQPKKLQQDANLGSSTDMSETNKLLTQVVEFTKKTLDQNEKLMNKLIRTTGDLGVA